MPIRPGDGEPDDTQILKEALALRLIIEEHLTVKWDAQLYTDPDTDEKMIIAEQVFIQPTMQTAERLRLAVEADQIIEDLPDELVGELLDIGDALLAKWQAKRETLK